MSIPTSKPPDFIARLTYRTTEEGGRKTLAFSGYRPAIQFGFSKMFTSGQQIFLDKEVVYPGEIVIAEIRIIATGYFKNTLDEGVKFIFCEGRTIIGTGRIIKLINEELRYR
jgi:translation elongation factor EF-Tu-like GTPase